MRGARDGSASCRNGSGQQGARTRRLQRGAGGRAAQGGNRPRLTPPGVGRRLRGGLGQVATARPREACSALPPSGAPPAVLGWDPVRSAGGAPGPGDGWVRQAPAGGGVITQRVSHRNTGDASLGCGALMVIRPGLPVRAPTDSQNPPGSSAGWTERNRGAETRTQRGLGGHTARKGGDEVAPPAGWGRPEHIYQRQRASCFNVCAGQAPLPAPLAPASHPAPTSQPRQGPLWPLRPSLTQPQLQGLLCPVAAQDRGMLHHSDSAVRFCGHGTHGSDGTIETTRPGLGPPHFQFLTPGSWPTTSTVSPAQPVSQPLLLGWLHWACSALWALNVSGVSILKAFQGAGCPAAPAPPIGPPHHVCEHAGAAGRSQGTGDRMGFRVQQGSLGCRGSDEGAAC